MSAPEANPAAPGPTKSRLRSAMEARDIDAIADAFAPDAALHSPLTGLVTFSGRAEIASLMEVILDVFEDFRYTDELGEADRGFLVAKARVGGQAIEIVDHMRFAPDGRITDFTVFFRPLPAAATALRAIGVALGRRRSRARAFLISALAHPLALMTRVGDSLGVRLARPAP